MQSLRFCTGRASSLRDTNRHLGWGTQQTDRGTGTCACNCIRVPVRVPVRAEMLIYVPEEGNMHLKGHRLCAKRWRMKACYVLLNLFSIYRVMLHPDPLRGNETYTGAKHPSTTMPFSWTIAKYRHIGKHFYTFSGTSRWTFGHFSPAYMSPAAKVMLMLFFFPSK